MRLLVGLLFLLVTTAEAETVGVSYFAMNAFSPTVCKEALKVFDGAEVPAVAILWRSFTRSTRASCIARFLRKYKDRHHILEIHFSNESGRRNRRLAWYEFLPWLDVNDYNRAIEQKNRRVLTLISREASSINKFIKKYTGPKTELLVSTGLEDNYTTQAYNIILRTLKKKIRGSVRFVRNPGGTNESNYSWRGARFIELHSDRPQFSAASRGRCIANLDGTDIDFNLEGDRSDFGDCIYISKVPDFIRRYRAHGCLVFLWWREPQGIERGFVHPLGRTFRIYHSHVNKIRRLL